MAWLLLFGKGMAMGAADMIPGISGGTIALITNIYEELIHSLKRLNPFALKVLFQKGMGAFWRHINGNFLLVLLSGIVCSLLLFAHSVTYLLAHYPEYVRALFCGLVLASSWYIWSQMQDWRVYFFLLLLLGIICALSLAFLPQPQQQAGALWFYFICGAVAICAMILPGISGAFILVLLGTYEPLLVALKAMDIPVILVFVCGCVSGLMGFIHLLSWLFKHYREQLLACLLGVLLGSLYKVWPWQQTLVTQTDNAGNAVSVISRAITPAHFAELNGQNAGLALCLLLFLGGFFLVLFLERWGQHSEE